MKLRLLALVLSFLLLPCLVQAAKQSIKTVVDLSNEPSKAALHFVCPPSARQPIEERNLYPAILQSLKENGISVTQDIKEAKYLVFWGSNVATEKVDSYRYMPTFSTTQGNVYAGNAYGNAYGNYSGTTTGGTYVPCSYNYTAKSFSIEVCHIVGENVKDWPEVWKGISVAESNKIKDASLIIESLLSRYGKAFDGNVSLDEALKIRKKREKELSKATGSEKSSEKSLLPSRR